MIIDGRITRRTAAVPGKVYRHRVATVLSEKFIYYLRLPVICTVSPPLLRILIANLLLLLLDCKIDYSNQPINPDNKGRRRVPRFALGKIHLRKRGDTRHGANGPLSHLLPLQMS